MKISIIGAAGTVGACTTYTIAEHGIADEIVMFDTRLNHLMNHMMDISISAQIRHDTIVRAGKEDKDLLDSDIVIIAAGSTLQSEQTGERQSERDMIGANVNTFRPIAENIARYCPDAAVITASNPTDTINYIIYAAGSLKKEKLIGYNLNDSIRFRIAIAKAIGAKTSQVEAIVAGIHPEIQILLSNSLKVNGERLRLEEELKKHIRDEATNYLKTFNSFPAGRTAGWTTGQGIADIVTNIVNGNNIVMTCSVIVDGEYGVKQTSLGLPVVIGRQGVQKIVNLDLTTEEEIEIAKAGQKMFERAAMVRKLLGLIN